MLKYAFLLKKVIFSAGVHIFYILRKIFELQIYDPSFLDDINIFGMKNKDYL